MRRIPAFLVPLAALAACSDRDYHGEEFSLYYRKPAAETRSERVERKEVVHWPSSPKDKKRIGFLHRYQTQVEGSREIRDSWYIFDRYGERRIGFITNEGVFYRFDWNGRIGERVGEYTVVATGLKVFFGIPLKENVDLEDIDPYK
jgi:hypothetical protein